MNKGEERSIRKKSIRKKRKGYRWENIKWGKDEKHEKLYKWVNKRKWKGEDEKRRGNKGSDKYERKWNWFLVDKRM